MEVGWCKARRSKATCRCLETAAERPYCAAIALQGFIEDVELSNTNTLTYNRVYSKIGQTNLLAADPAVVHFGGFQLGQVLGMAWGVCMALSA